MLSNAPCRSNNRRDLLKPESWLVLSGVVLLRAVLPEMVVVALLAWLGEGGTIAAACLPSDLKVTMVYSKIRLAPASAQKVRHNKPRFASLLS